MNLIEPLAGGIRGAGYGTAVVKRRATDTDAAVYADFSGRIRRWGTLNLSSHGHIEAYTNEYVDVTVYTAAGVLLRTFTVGTDAAAVDTRNNDSFPGHDNLEDILSGVVIQFGTTDWNVVVNGNDVSLMEALGGLAGVYFNVKAREYGAQGDGASDDARQIASAISACDVAGGGIVFFPPGDYLTSLQLTVPAGVSLLGCGGEVTSLRVTDANQRALYFPAYGERGMQFVDKMYVGATVEHPVSLVTAVRGAGLVIRNCELGDVNCTGPLFELQNSNNAGSDDVSMVRLTGNRLVCGGTTEDDDAFGRAIDSYAEAATARITVEDCVFVPPATCGTTNGIALVVGLCVHLNGCRFDSSGFTAGLISSAIRQDTAHSYGSVRNCWFDATGGGDVETAMSAVMTDTADYFVDIGNFADQTGATIERTRDIVQGDSQTSYGYYCKSDSTHYYGEEQLPAIPGSNVSVSTPSMATPEGIVAVNMANTNFLTNVRFLSSRSVLGDSCTFVGYASGFNTGDYTSDSSDATFTFHTCSPAVSLGVGINYFALKMRMVRTLGSPGPTLRTKWYCVGVGGITKTGFARTSY